MDVQAMLCAYAEVSGNKLFITGAGINLVATPAQEPPHPVTITLAVLVAVPWHATNQLHTLAIELISDPGAGAHERIPLAQQLPPDHDVADRGKAFAQFNVGRGPFMKPGEDSLLPIAIPLLGFGLPRPGAYFFAIELDGSEVRRVSFRVESAATVAQVIASQ